VQQLDRFDETRADVLVTDEPDALPMHLDFLVALHFSTPSESEYLTYSIRPSNRPKRAASVRQTSPMALRFLKIIVPHIEDPYKTERLRALVRCPLRFLTCFRDVTLLFPFHRKRFPT
jgi:hypothetical protein